MTLSLLDLKNYTTPKQYADFIRQQGRISWWQKGEYWLVTDYEIAKNILLDDRFSADRTPFFMRRMHAIDKSLIKNFYQAVSKMMVMSDKPIHHGRRRICQHAINYYLQNNLKDIVNKYLDVYFRDIKTDSFDFMKVIAEPLPVDVMSELFDIPYSEKKKFYYASHAMTMFFGGASQYTNKEGMIVDGHAKYITDLLKKIINYKKHNRKDDFISILLSNQSNYQLDDDEIVSQLVMLMVAGQVTLSDQLCHNIYTIFSDPINAKLLYQQDAAYAKILLEANRLDPAVTFTFRVASQDMDYHNCFIKQDDAVFISNHAVNRDPCVFIEPDNFNIEKNLTTNFSFGYGAHFCIGSKIGLLQMELTLKKLINSFSKISINPFLTARAHDSLAFSGFKSLNLAVEKWEHNGCQSHVTTYQS